LILELKKRGKTILLCSHLLADVEDVCDRIAILYGGRIQSEGEVKELLEQTGKRQITTGPISDGTVARIVQIVEGEQGDCEVTSPMEKLETFFIRTVSAAEEQAQPTSGAVASTQIGGFLTRETPVESILDKLVSGAVPQQTSPSQPSTEQAKPVEPSQPEADEQFLRELAGPVEPVQGAAEVTTEPVETDGDEPAQPEKTRQSILDQLTGRSTSQGKEQKPADDSQGDEGNA
jgi:ABC-2 type transport system ATP-binding protein